MTLQKTFLYPNFKGSSMGVIHKNLCELHSLGNSTKEWICLRHRGKERTLQTMHVAGYTEAGPGYEFVRLAPPFGGVLVTERGCGEALVEGTWRVVPEGWAYIMPPRTLHAYKVRGSESWRLHWVLYGERVGVPGLKSGAEAQLVQVEGASFRHAVEGLCKENMTLGDSATEGLWTELIDRSVARFHRGAGACGRLDAVWARVREDLSGAWSLERLSRESGLGGETLRRLCLSQLGRPPMKELIRLRMESAAVLLRHSHEKVSEVARRVGYEDAFAFSTSFKRYWGKGPRAFRCEHQEGAFF